MAVFPFLFWFFKDRLWILLVLSIPALLLGEVLSIPITSEWVYEARLSEALLFSAFTIFVLDCYINNRPDQVKLDKIAFILLFFLAISTISFFYISDFRFFIVGSKVSFFSFAAYFLALNSFLSKDSIKWLLRSLVLFVFLISVQVFLKFYEMGFSTKFFFERSYIEIPLGPIALVSAFLAFLLPVVLCLYFSQEKEGRVGNYVNLLVFLAGSLAIFLGLGKAAIFSFGLGLFYIFVKMPKKRTIFILTAAGFLSLSLVFFTSFFTGLLERVARTFISENTQFRLTEYQVGWSIIKDNPLIGIGTGQQLLYYKEILDWDNPQLVNNYFLHALIEWGIVGLGIVSAMIITIYRKTRSKLKEVFGHNNRVLTYGFVAGFLAVLVNGLAEVTVFALPYAIVFFLVLGLFNNLEKYA